MNQKNQARQEASAKACAEASRQQWIDAVEKMADQEEIKARIEYLERQVAAHTFGNWPSR